MAHCKREIVARLHIPPLGTPGRTDLSTNATCQLEKTENFASKRHRRTTDTVPQRFGPRPEENRKNRNMCQMFGIRVRFRDDAMLSTKVLGEFEVQ
jgi:hypothetical protein